MNNQTIIIEGLVDAIEDALELIEGYVDSKDDENGQPVANNAMRAERLLIDALAKVKVPSKPPAHRFSNRKEVRENIISGGREMWNTNLVYKSNGWYWIDEEGKAHGPYSGRGSYQQCAKDAMEYDNEMTRVKGGLQREF
jgi:hypothetical protein